MNSGHTIPSPLGPPNRWSSELSVALGHWLAPSLGKCGFLECVWVARAVLSCPGTDSLVIAKECIRHRVAPEFSACYICFPQNRIVFEGESPVIRTLAGGTVGGGACTFAVLWLLTSSLSQSFPLAYVSQLWWFLQHTVNFSAASCSAHWLPLCLNGRPSFLFMSLILTPGPLYLPPFCLLNRCFFFFKKKKP